MNDDLWDWADVAAVSRLSLWWGDEPSYVMLVMDDPDTFDDDLAKLLHAEFAAAIRYGAGAAVCRSNQTPHRHDGRVQCLKKLHDGSRWDGDSAVSSEGVRVSINRYDEPMLQVESDTTDRGYVSSLAEIQDVHAVLARAGHCPNSSSKTDGLLVEIYTASKRAIDASADVNSLLPETETAWPKGYDFGELDKAHVEEQEALSALREALERVERYLREKGPIP